MKICQKNIKIIDLLGQYMILLLLGKIQKNHLKDLHGETQYRIVYDCII